MVDRELSILETLELALYIHIMQNFSSSKVLFEYNSSIYKKKLIVKLPRLNLGVYCEISL